MRSPRAAPPRLCSRVSRPLRPRGGWLKCDVLVGQVSAPGVFASSLCVCCRPRERRAHGSVDRFWALAGVALRGALGGHGSLGCLFLQLRHRQVRSRHLCDGRPPAGPHDEERRPGHHGWYHRRESLHPPVSPHSRAERACAQIYGLVVSVLISANCASRAPVLFAG